MNQNQNEWGKNNNNEKGNKVNQFSVLVGNYPPMFTADAIVKSLVDQIRRFIGSELNAKIGLQFPNSLEFTISLPNSQQEELLITLNGTYVFNNPIWIIKFPHHLEQYGFDLTEVFSVSISNGQVDLSDLRKRFQDIGKNPKDIDFNNRDFVEFFFYRLGSESRDRRFFVDSLILNNNFIKNVNWWGSFLIFLPTLHTLILNQNPLEQPPNLPLLPNLKIECDYTKGSKQNKQQKNNNNQGWGFNYNQDQNQGHQDQSSWGKGKNKF